jgi:hypothetical protein
VVFAGQPSALTKKPCISWCVPSRRVAEWLQSKRGTEMAAQAISIERRESPREGVMGQLEDITYAALRRYGVIGEVRPGQLNSFNQPAASIQ